MQLHLVLFALLIIQYIRRIIHLLFVSTVWDRTGIELATTADPGVASSIPVRSHTFVEIDHEMISTVILLPSADSFKKGVVSYKRKYVHELLVNRLFKPAQEKVWLEELTVPQ